MLYLIGSLRNPNVPKLANELRSKGFSVFDDWFSPGPDTDWWWEQHEKYKGKTFTQALDGLHAHHVFNFDRTNLDRSTLGILLLPAGKSGHLELGYLIGQGKPGYILLNEEPKRWDVMYRFATKVCNNKEELFDELSRSYAF